MPRNTLRHLDALAGVAGQRPSERQGRAEGAAFPAELHALLNERRQLEHRMTALTGGGGQESNPSADRRFPVTPLDQRRRLDAEWARRRNQATDTLRRTVDEAVGDLGSRALQELSGPPERSGQRAIHGPLERSGQRQTLSPGHQEVQRIRQTLGESVRSSSDLDLDRLNDDPGLRDFGREFPELPTRELRSVDDLMRTADEKLDILKGGSGDLGRLREVAVERLGVRRQEQQRDAQRDARRSDRRQSVDDDRDMARLDSREVR